jgi:hypothetical protein
LKNETEQLREELEGKENTINRVKADHGQALHFSMEEKNREMDRLRHRLEDLQSQLELAEEAARSKEKVRVNRMDCVTRSDGFLSNVDRSSSVY